MVETVLKDNLFPLPLAMSIKGSYTIVLNLKKVQPLPITGRVLHLFLFVSLWWSTKKTTTPFSKLPQGLAWLPSSLE